jgi:hypothetical protein
VTCGYSYIPQPVNLLLADFDITLSMQHIMLHPSENIEGKFLILLILPFYISLQPYISASGPLMMPCITTSHGQLFPARILCACSHYYI